MGCKHRIPPQNTALVPQQTFSRRCLDHEPLRIIANLRWIALEASDSDGYNVGLGLAEMLSVDRDLIAASLGTACGP